MTDIDTLRDEWGTIYVASGSKTHIMPACRYVTDAHQEKDVATYPAAHIDLCSWCEERFERWRNGTDGKRTQCQRCGATTTDEYCDDCQAHIKRMEARR